MADAYWRFGDGRQPPPSQGIPPTVGKRPRSDYDAPGSHDMSSYFPRDDERGTLRAGREADSIGASYDRYLRSAQVSSYNGGEPGRPMTGGITNHPIDDPRAMGKDRGFGGWPEISLPHDASSTLFVEGLPANCTRREVSHIFRPFVGYKEVRLVSKDSRRSGGDSLVLCFVDFLSPAHAATAMDALQGYEFDEHDRDSVRLRLQFSRYPGARSGGRDRHRDRGRR